MSVSFIVDLTCDRCQLYTQGRVAIDKLKPTAEMHLELPEGWSCGSRIDSHELYILCSDCPPGSTSLASPEPVHMPSPSEDDPTYPGGRKTKLPSG